MNELEIDVILGNGKHILGQIEIVIDNEYTHIAAHPQQHRTGNVTTITNFEAKPQKNDIAVLKCTAQNFLDSFNSIIEIDLIPIPRGLMEKYENIKNHIFEIEKFINNH